jgi:hypothetical protein
VTDQINGVVESLKGQVAEAENIRKELNDVWVGRIEEYKLTSAALHETAAGLVQRLNPEQSQSLHPAGKKNYQPCGRSSPRNQGFFELYNLFWSHALAAQLWVSLEQSLCYSSGCSA